MTPDPPTTNPSLRFRLPLYPGQVIGAMAMASLGPLLDPMMTDLHVPLSRGGIISAGYFLGVVLGIVVMNALLGGMSLKWTLVGGAALQGAGLLVAGVASRGMWSAAAAYLVVGLGGALLNNSCWIWLAAHIKKNMAGSALAMVLYFALGMILTPLILGLAMDNGATWRGILAVEGAICLAPALVFVFMPVLDAPGRRNLRFAHVKEVVAHHRRLLFAIAGAGFMYTGAESVLNVWLPKFQLEVFAVSDAWASLTVTLFWVGLAAGRLLTMPLTRRFAPARLLLACCLIMAAFAVAVAFSPSQTVSLAFTVAAGLGASASYALIGSYVGRFPGWQSGVASSFFVLSGAVGGTALPYLLGPLASAAGLRIGLAATAAPALVCAVLALVIHGSTRENRA
jgi:fucose permease